MRGRLVFALVVALIGLDACGRPSASGIYTLTSETKAGLLQLVQTGKGDVAGRFEAVALKADGTIQDLSASVTGVADGKVISLSLQSGETPNQKLDATATLDGDKLTLAIANVPAAIELRKSNLSEFEKHAAGLRERSTKLLAQQAAAAASQRQQQELAELDARQSQAAAAQLANQQAAASTLVSTATHLTTILDGFAARLDRVKERAASTEREFQAISARLSDLHEHRKALTVQNTGQYDNLRTALQNRTEALHDWVSRGVEDLTRDEENLSADIGRIQVACAATTGSSSGVTQIDTQKACTDLKLRMTVFQVKSRQTAAALARVDAAYNAARTAA